MGKKIEGIFLYGGPSSIKKICVLTEKEDLVVFDKYIFSQDDLISPIHTYDSFMDVVHIEGPIYKVMFDLDEVGWAKEPIDEAEGLIQHRIIPLDHEKLTELVREIGHRSVMGSHYAYTLPVLLDVEERRKLVDNWTNPMDSYTKEDPMYYNEPVLIREKAVIWVPGVTF